MSQSGEKENESCQSCWDLTPMLDYVICTKACDPQVTFYFIFSFFQLCYVIVFTIYILNNSVHKEVARSWVIMNI